MSGLIPEEIKAKRERNERERVARKAGASKVVEVPVEKIVEKEVRVEVPVDGFLPIDGVTTHTLSLAVGEFRAWDGEQRIKDLIKGVASLSKETDQRVIFVVSIPKGLKL